MPIKVCSWNINSVRLREDSVCRLLSEETPDVLCLQECKSPEDKIPTKKFSKLGYNYLIASGQKGYNGVAILSRLPLKEISRRDFASLEHARHIAVNVDNKLNIHNFYVPAGGDIPDRNINAKFGQKLDYLSEMAEYFQLQKPQKSILVGDLNIAPGAEDVWDHKKLLKIVSHTPQEIQALNEVMLSADWVDIIRKDIPLGLLYSWWSYRARDWDTANKGRRLDHIWATKDIAEKGYGSYISRDVRGWEKPSDHAPIFASFDL
ncbi:exodeoxyribonuclease III [Amylibacter sp.]|nr:exodeoxyribonuclease III [Amylibacter sp.]